MVSGLADAVLSVAEGVGLSGGTVARYGKCCEVVVGFCGRRDFGALSVRVAGEFAACQQERARRGEIGPGQAKRFGEVSPHDGGVPENRRGGLAGDEPRP
jgi:hypothetical protein